MNDEHRPKIRNRMKNSSFPSSFYKFVRKMSGFKTTKKLSQIEIFNKKHGKNRKNIKFILPTCMSGNVYINIYFIKRLRFKPKKK